MNPMALVGASVGGVVGAIIWGALAYMTGFEIGYVAWGVGGLVGFGAVLLGGRGSFSTAVACGAIALGSIVAGRALAIQLTIDAMVPREIYNVMMQQAQAFSHVKSKREIPMFMVTQGYTTTMDPGDIPREEVREFTEIQVPVLKQLHAEKPTFEEWKETPDAQARLALVAAVPMAEFLKESVGFIDIIFALLGMATAFKVCLGEGQDEVIVQELPPDTGRVSPPQEPQGQPEPGRERQPSLQD